MYPIARQQPPTVSEQVQVDGGYGYVAVPDLCFIRVEVFGFAGQEFEGVLEGEGRESWH